MDSWGCLLFFVIAVIIAIIVLPIVAFVQANAAKQEVEHLREQFTVLNNRLAHLTQQVAELVRQAGSAPSGTSAPTERRPPSAAPIEPPPPVAAPSTVLPKQWWTSLPPTEAPPPPPEAPPAPSTPEIPAPLSVSPVRPVPTPTYTHLPLPTAPPVVKAAGEPPPPPQEKSMTAAELEVLIGGKWFLWIGAVVLVIGLGFGYQLAVRRGWITQDERVLFGLLVGIGLLVAGRRFHRQGLPIFAQGLVGAAIGVLYLSVYAAYGFYHLPYVTGEYRWVALLALSAVTVTAIWQSLLYDSVVISLLALIGGFLTPILLGNEAPTDASTTALFIYLAFLDAGLLAVAVRKDRWRAIEPLAIAGTSFLFWMWTATRDLSLAWMALPFLVVVWDLFQTAQLVRAAQGINTYGNGRQAQIVSVGLLLWAGLHASLTAWHYTWTVWTLLAVAVVYMLCGQWLRRLQARASEGGAGTGTVLPVPVLAVAVAVQEVAGVVALAAATYEWALHFDVVILWAVEAIALIWVGRRTSSRHVWMAALCLFGLAVLRLFLEPGAFAFDPIEEYRVLLTERSLAYLVLIVGGGLSTFLFRGKEGSDEDVIATTLHYAWTALLFVLVTVEINDFFLYLDTRVHGYSYSYPLARTMSMAVAWTLYSLPLVWLGLRKPVVPLIIVGLLSLGSGAVMLAIYGAAYNPIGGFEPIVNLRTLPFLVVLVGLWLQARWLEKRGHKGEWTAFVAEAVRIVLALLTFELLTVEWNDSVRYLEAVNYVGPLALDLMRVLGFGVIWALYSLVTVALSLRRKSSGLLVCGLGALAASIVTIVPLAAQYQPISQFMPVLNGRALTFVVVAIAAGTTAYLFRTRPEAFPSLKWLVPTLHVVVALLAFELITVEIIDTCAHADSLGLGTTYALDFLKILAFGVAWALYALVVNLLAFRAKSSWLLVCGLGALAASIVTIVPLAAQFQPIEHFIPVLNVRMLAFVVLAGIVGVTARLFRTRPEAFPDTKGLLPVFHLGVALLAFELVTVELNDLVGHADTLRYGRAYALDFLRILGFGAAWAIYSVVVGGIALQKKSLALMICAILGCSAGVFVLAFMAMSYQPLGGFLPAFNVRALAFLIVAVTMGTGAWRLRVQRDVFPNLAFLTGVGHVVVALLLLELVSVETWDAFARPLAALAASSDHQVQTLQQLQQLGLSLSWLVYSIILLGHGIWKKLRVMRYIAVGVFVISICKTCLFDSTFLGDFRWLGFVALAVLIMGASYLYLRFKDLILGELPAQAPAPKADSGEGDAPSEP